MTETTAAPMSGRRAQAVRNNELILEAARAVFIADPEAPISAVAERAGVGISALYRRYRGKEELLQKLCADGLATYLAAVEAAVADEGDPWRAFVTFMRRVVDADTHSLTMRLAGTFTPTEELHRMATRAGELNERLVARARDAGVLRPDIEYTDLGVIFEQIAAVRGADDQRTSELRHRYLALILVAMRAPGGEPLPGPPPRPGEFASRWQPKRNVHRGGVD